jgi:ribosomal-protein-alanine N-acetyltransferase
MPHTPTTLESLWRNVVNEVARGIDVSPRILAVVESAVPQGVMQETLYLEVEEDNKPARALYGKMGFVTAGVRKGYYRKSDGNFANALIMKLGLDGL